MSVNKVILIGRVGQDPEIRHTQGGQAVANFSVATSERWKDKKTGEAKETTEWHKCVAWGSLAENVIAKWVHKGDPLYVEGKIETRKWQDKSGQDRYTTEIRVKDVTLLGGKSSGQTDYQRPKQAPDFDDQIPF